MDERKRKLQGSVKRDIFRRKHKEINDSFYACDGDLCLIDKYPPGTVAYLDYKDVGDEITFAEVIQYNKWMTEAPVYVIEAKDPDNGPFRILRYLGGDWRPEPPNVNLEHDCHLADWQAYEKWEADLRTEYRRRGGWNGKLRIESELSP